MCMQVISAKYLLERQSFVFTLNILQEIIYLIL